MDLATCDPVNAGSQAEAEGRFPPGVPLSKRIFDGVFAGVALLFFAPFIALIALLIRVVEGGPVFFVQQRVGHGGRHFPCIKFRTMAVDADARLAALLAEDPEIRAEWEATRKLRCDPRVSAIGRFLRKTSLDELPQFLNVLRGEMSVVGPRPIIDDEAVLYRAGFWEYKSVRPGLTGVWQISGRSDTTFAERVRMDIDYVRNWSFGRDLWIVMRTVYTVVAGKGAR